MGFPYQPEERRRSYHCGYMEPEEWTELRLPVTRETERVLFYDPAGNRLPDEDIVCPGWLVRLPEVLEGAHAYSVRKDGAIEQYYPNLENAVLEAADVVALAVSEYEAEQLRKMNNG